MFGSSLRAGRANPKLLRAVALQISPPRDQWRRQHQRLELGAILGAGKIGFGVCEERRLDVALDVWFITASGSRESKTTSSRSTPNFAAQRSVAETASATGTGRNSGR